MEQGDYPGAVALTLGPVQDAANGWNKALSDGVDFEEKESREAAAEAIRWASAACCSCWCWAALRCLLASAPR